MFKRYSFEASNGQVVRAWSLRGVLSLAARHGLALGSVLIKRGNEPVRVL